MDAMSLRSLTCDAACLVSYSADSYDVNGLRGRSCCCAVGSVETSMGIETPVG